MMKKTVAVIFALVVALCVAAQDFDQYNGARIVKNRVIVKFKAKSTLKSSYVAMPAPPSVNEPRLHEFLQTIAADEPVQKYPNAKMPEDCDKCVDISRIYAFSYHSNMPMAQVLDVLNQMDCVEYAVPVYVSELMYDPNDTEYKNGNLWHLKAVNALKAWDVEKGDPSMVVAVIDGGFDIIHKDLKGKIAYNYNDPITGTDDDNDGYVDNYRGWDFGNGDNNPTSTTEGHGTMVAGIVAAEVDNEFGVAGIAFNCKFLPIKVCADGFNTVTDEAGYDGIAYGANQGCKVLNCSWGGSSYSDFCQDIVDYATYNCDALIVASAGNSAEPTMYYPASFKSVMSAGGTDVGDLVWADGTGKGTHYNRFVDICAPAKNFHSTTNNDATGSVGRGTSYSAPIVSGAAALVRCKYPHYTALQARELLRSTVDDIYEINSEAKYQDRLGNGRLNIYKALTDQELPGIRITDYRVQTRSGQPHIYAGDTIDVHATFKNYLRDAENLVVTIACELGSVTALKKSVTFPLVPAGAEVEGTFTFRVSSTLGTDLESYFKFSYSAAHNYKSYEYHEVSFNPDYHDFSIGNIQSTATRDGSVAIYNSFADQNGLKYKDNENCIADGGVVLAIRDLTEFATRNRRQSNFKPLLAPEIIKSDTCDLIIHSNFSYRDSLKIDQYLVAWEDEDVLIYDYRISNVHYDTLANVYFGMYVNWGVANVDYNKVWYDDTLQLSIAEAIYPYPFVIGFMPLDYHETNVYAFDIDYDVVNVYDGFSPNEFRHMLNTWQPTAGTNDVYGGNVAAIYSSLIDTIAPEDTAEVKYAMLFAENPDALLELAYKFKQKYNPRRVEDPDTTGTGTGEISQREVTIRKEQGNYSVIYEPSTEPLAVKVYTVQGLPVEAMEILPENQTGAVPLGKYATGVYVAKVTRNGSDFTFKIIVR